MNSLFFHEISCGSSFFECNMEHFKKFVFKSNKTCPLYLILLIKISGVHFQRLYKLILGS